MPVKGRPPRRPAPRQRASSVRRLAIQLLGELLGSARHQIALRVYKSTTPKPAMTRALHFKIARGVRASVSRCHSQILLPVNATDTREWGEAPIIRAMLTT